MFWIWVGMGRGIIGVGCFIGGGRGRLLRMWGWVCLPRTRQPSDLKLKCVFCRIDSRFLEEREFRKPPIVG